MISPPPFCVFKLNLLMGYFTEGGAFRFRTEGSFFLQIIYGYFQVVGTQG